MDENVARGVARRAAPYGQPAVPANDLHEHPTEQDELAIQRRWQRICEQFGARILGIRDVPTSPVLAKLDGIFWELAPIGTTEREVPAEVFHRWRALEGKDVPFLYWLWGEEQPQRPNLRPLPELRTVPWRRASVPLRDPVLIGVIPTAVGRGVWVMVGKWLH